MQLATSRSKRAMNFGVMALALGWLALSAGAAHAQVPPPFTPPGEDHYLVYPVLNRPQLTVPVILSDQFIQHATYQTISLDYFMTPVNKNNEGMIDDVTHYTWWRTSTQSFGATALISNQFGPDQAIQVLQPHFLLNPALKSIPPLPPPNGPIPFKNHYLVYDAFGPPVAKPVFLLDQFWQYQGLVELLRYLAPPVEKIFQGQIFPILDPINHLAIYDFIQQPPMMPPPGPVFARDEFGIWQLQLGQPIWLCVPSYKTGVVGTNARSWGRLKTLYR